MSGIFTSLLTNKLQLRHFAASDIAKVYEGLSHSDVIRYYGVSFETLEETAEQMKWFKQLIDEGLGIWLAITSPDGKVFYGAVGLNNLSQVHKKAELGFWLLPNFWGQGIMAEAVNLLCEFAFREMQLHRIEALVETPNEGSRNLLTKLNFKHEGTMEDGELKNGKFISLAIYAKLNPNS